MKSGYLSEGWMPPYVWSANTTAILDETYCDFEAQAERLTGHDQDYVQLSPGPFRGRFVSSFLGQSVSLHVETANQTLQQTVIGAPNAFPIGVVMNNDTEFRVHGRPVDDASLFIVPPGGTLHLRSPADASILAVVIEETLLLDKLSAAPHIYDWVAALDQLPAVMFAPVLAERVRQDAYNALKSCANEEAGGLIQPVLGDILATSFATALMLEWTDGIQFCDAAVPRSFERFLAIQATPFKDTTSMEIGAVSDLLKVSPRSIQYVCAQEGTMGFGAYQRLLRLHATRRCLRDPAHKHRSIGDVASDFGFLNWSHFGEQYREAFGERPSDTRQGTIAEA